MGWQLEEKATNQRKPVVVTDLTYVWKPVSQGTSYLKKRPAGYFLCFIFWRSIPLHQILLDLLLIHYHHLLLYSWVALAKSPKKAHCTIVFKDISFIPPLCCVKVTSTVQRYRCKFTKGLASLWYVHAVFTCQGYLCYCGTTGHRYHPFWVADRERRASAESCFVTALFFGETFTRRYGEVKPRCIAPLTFCENASWWNLRGLTFVLSEINEVPLDLDLQRRITAKERQQITAPSEALTCLYLLGPQCRFGHCVHLCVAGAGYWGHRAI